MYYTPLNYDKINVMAGTYQPSPIKAFNNQYYAYWERSLFQRAQSNIILNVPWDGSERDFLYYCLFTISQATVSYPTRLSRMQVYRSSILFMKKRS